MNNRSQQSTTFWQLLFVGVVLLFLVPPVGILFVCGALLYRFMQ